MAAGQAAAQVYASEPSLPERLEGSLLDLPVALEAPLAAATGIEEVPLLTIEEPAAAPAAPTLGHEDPAAQLDAGEAGVGLAPSPPQFLNQSVNFEGMNVFVNGLTPPDTQGDVGPDHYIQVVNSSFQIFDKTGASLFGPASINTLWSGVSDLQEECRDNNNGDPIVLYDHLADRWLITQFARPATRLPDFQCIAVSMTPDPVAGGWILYQFRMVDENGADFSHDYPKIGVWPDGYYMGSQEGFYGGDLNLVVFDRQNMLSGNAAGYQSLDGGNETFFWLPADLDGPAPGAGTPAYFARQIDSDYRGVGGNDRIEIVEFKTDWADSNNTTLSAVQSIDVIPFDERLCGGGDPNLFQYCIPQPDDASDDGTVLEALTVWPMWRLQYRRFATRDTLVFNHTVNADGNGTAGVRWYELQRSPPGTGAWSLRQQGTFAPQDPANDHPEHRWMGSVAMDRFGNLALGYSVSSENLIADGDADDGYPSIRYTGREDDAALGLMPETEVTMAQGTDTQNAGGQGRWGDYSAMVVDPVDDCTFWYTQQYINTAFWNTRVGAFSFADCSADLSVTKSAEPTPGTAGTQITYTITVENDGILDATDVVVTDTLPAGFSFVADNLPGTECADTTEPTIVCNIGDLDAGDSASFTITAAIASDILGPPDPDGPSTFDNVVSVEGDQSDLDESNNEYTLSTLVNELADLSVAKVCKPDGPAVAGEEDGFCEIWVDNNGPSMSRNVALVDEILSEISFNIETPTTDQGSCSIVGDNVECDLGDIDAGERVTVVVTVNTSVAGDVNDKVTVSSDTPDPDTSNNMDEGSITFVDPTADLLVTKTCSPVAPAPAGTDAECQIVVRNNGPSPAVNVALYDDISSEGLNLDFSWSDTGFDSCVEQTIGVTSDPDGQDDLECTVASLAAGAEATVVVTFNEDDPVEITDVATVSSDTVDPDTDNNADEGLIVFAPLADVGIVKSVLPTPDVIAGDPAGLTYTIVATNYGPSTAVNVRVADVLPAGLHSVGVSGTGGAACVAGVPGDSTQPAVCTFDSIANGGFETMTITAIVDAAVPDGTVLQNSAAVSADTADTNNANDIASAPITVQAVADLSLSKSDSPDPALAGAILTYEYGIHNSGPSVAVNVALVDLLPAEVTLVSYDVTNAPDNCYISDPATNELVCEIGNMAPGQNVSVSVDVMVDPSVPHGTLIENNATVGSETEDDDLSNNSASAETTINTAADLWIDKTGNFETGNPSTTIIYFLTVYNRPGESEDDPQNSGDGGPSDAQNVVVTDALPTTGKKNEPVSIVYLSEDCSAVGLVVTCQTDTIKVGEAAQHEIHIQVSGKVESLNNVASFTSDTFDPISGNNSDSLLMVVKGGSDRPGGPGGGRGRGSGGKN